MVPSRRSCLRTAGILAAVAAAGDRLVDPAGLRRALAAEPAPAASLDVMASDLAREEVPPREAAAAATAVQDFTGDLFGVLAAGSSTGNLVCSPYSVLCAVAMARTGALGRTATEIDAVLHAPTPAPQALNTSLNALDQLLSSRAGTIRRTGLPDAEISIDVANSLWGQRGVAWEQDFLDALARDFGAAMNLVDYRTDADGARRTINAWVSDRTHEKIPDLLAPGVLDAMTRLVLVNAIYLKAPWAMPFMEGATTDAPFHTDAGGSLRVPMMRGEDRSLPYQEGDGWVAVDLPYLGGKLAMAVVVPDQGTSGALAASVDGAWLRRVLGGFTSTRIRLSMPRWKFRTSAELTPALRGLGMPTAFTDAADFGGMTSEAELSIAAAVHEAFIAVDEEGTEAAAATALVMGVTSVQQPGRAVTVDRPFLFVIHDVQTSTPLFVGRVVDPTAG